MSPEISMETVRSLKGTILITRTQDKYIHLKSPLCHEEVSSIVLKVFVDNIHQLLHTMIICMFPEHPTLSGKCDSFSLVIVF